MDFYSFVEGPLLWFAFLLFIAGIVSRLTFFSLAVFKSSKDKEFKLGYRVATFGRLFLPFHRAALHKPLYSILRYIFHICLIAVPIWLSGHISLWLESRFEWEWSALPDSMADWMTLILLGIAVYFLVRRMVSSYVRTNTSLNDYVIIIIAVLPFLSGYFLAHGTLDEVPFLGANISTIHILSGEAMLIFVAFLFCRTRLNESRCTGCASCEISCPTGTLESNDTGKLRIFNYSHYQCICCGACVNTCPENAAELRHEYGLKRLFQIVKKQRIRDVEMELCQICGSLFVPEPLLNKIEKTFKYEYLHTCPPCRKRNQTELIRKLSPYKLGAQESLPR
jgi:NAD-dependent dihydropyrimidine dehydrogenase PreA subunit